MSFFWHIFRMSNLIFYNIKTSKLSIKTNYSNSIITIYISVRKLIDSVFMFNNRFQRAKPNFYYYDRFISRSDAFKR